MNFKLFGRVVFVSKPVLAVMAVIFLGVASIGGYGLLREKGEEVFFMGGTPTGNVTESPGGATGRTAAPEDGYIHVYVVGCVNNPGMVKLRKGQMIYDAVELAGGLTKEADKNNINMAYILTENMMLKILPEGETEASAGEKPGGKGVEVVRGITAGEEPQGSPGGNGGGKININTASVQELMTLPGIGEAKANDIINYRKTVGFFKSIEDIMKVPGIKDARFKAIKDKICV